MLEFSWGGGKTRFSDERISPTATVRVIDLIDVRLRRENRERYSIWKVLSFQTNRNVHDSSYQSLNGKYICLSDYPRYSYPTSLIDVASPCRFKESAFQLCNENVSIFQLDESDKFTNNAGSIKIDSAIPYKR